MNILHIVAGDLDGGAAKGAYTLHKALKKTGVDSKVLTNSLIKYDDSDVVNITYNQGQRRKNEFEILNQYKSRINFIYSTGFLGFDFTRLDVYKEADVIHLHWINDVFVDLSDLKKIDKPIIWTMRDMWSFTGGCHYAFECEKYKENCGACPQLNSTDEEDLSHLIFNFKQQNIPKNIQLVGISNWISEKARQSYLFKYFNIKTIYNNINAEDFKSIDKVTSKQALSLPLNKKIILIGAQNINAKYKGFELFIEACKYLNKERYFLAVFGRVDEEVIKALNFEYKLFGFVESVLKLNKIYSSADVFVAPSLMEAFGKTLAESLFCGTPVVCFDIAGQKDIVNHKYNGYKARAFDSSDLAEGINWVVNHTDYTSLVKGAATSANKAFDSLVVAEEYIGLYDKMIQTYTVQTAPKVSRTWVDKRVETLVKPQAYIGDSDQDYNTFHHNILALKKENLRYVIYGYGSIGKTIHKLIPENIIGYVDINDEKNHPEKLTTITFDKVIISVLGREELISKYLIEELKIGIEKIHVLEM